MQTILSASLKEGRYPDRPGGGLETAATCLLYQKIALIDKMRTWQRLGYKDREKAMDNVASHENWKSCFSEVAPGLLLFARQWVQSAADAEDVVQEAFVKFWRRNHKIENRALLYAAVRSIALDFIRRDSRRARREATAVRDTEEFSEPQFEFEDDTRRAVAEAIVFL